MTVAVRPAPPGRLRILGTQLRLLRTSRSIVSLALLLLASYSVAMLGIFSFEMEGAPGVFRCYPLLLVAGAAWAITVWQDTGRPRRDYFWALPVGRSSHALLRTGAGALWWGLGLILLVLLGAGLDALEKPPHQSASPLAWLSLFSGPLTLYLLVSAVAIVSAYPGRWAIGAVIGWTVLRRVCEGGTACGPTLAGRSVVGELAGLALAVTGVLRGEFVIGQRDTWDSPVLIGLWLAVGVVAVVLAARRPPQL